MATAPRILDQVRERIRLKHYSIRTEDTYLQWIRRLILFHGKIHPRDLGPGAIEAFLTHLAVQGGVAASTQSQAMNAIPHAAAFLCHSPAGVRLRHPHHLGAARAQ